MEFNVLDRLVKGQSVKQVEQMTKVSEKQVSTYKYNALKNSMLTISCSGLSRTVSQYACTESLRRYATYTCIR
ncbi:hypothetical protein [Klebsiella aerogenes]|uniref:hypothetical protein n=1 Tax=Klebsiella aerogenes TaxID=548 RepID=UPI0021CFD494|nr:hypothetical protein [Klebsiella aerogenes]